MSKKPRQDIPTLPTNNGNKIYLTEIEYLVFKILEQNKGKPTRATDIYDNIWGSTPNTTFRVLSTYIWRLRKKKLVDTEWYILSKYGPGFCFYTLYEKV